MSERKNSIAYVLEVDPTTVSEEEHECANNLCCDVNGKYYRIMTFAIDEESTIVLAQRRQYLKARVSYITRSNSSPYDWLHFQVEEILPHVAVPEESPVD